MMPKIVIHEDDLSNVSFSSAGSLSVDLETTGLDHLSCQILSCQVFDIENNACHIVRTHNTKSVPVRLVQVLLEKRDKVFHHAMFDLKFLKTNWNLEIEDNVFCTKIASKIVNSSKEKHSLKNLVRDELGVFIDKTNQLSDWSKKELSQEQIEYAVTDVIYLHRLLEALRKKANKTALELMNKSFCYIPHRVKLDLLGVGDVFTY